MEPKLQPGEFVIVKIHLVNNSIKLHVTNILYLFHIKNEVFFTLLSNMFGTHRPPPTIHVILLVNITVAIALNHWKA